MFLLGLMDSHVTSDRPNTSSGAIGVLLILFEDALDSAVSSPDAMAAIGSLLASQLAIISIYFSDHLIRSDDETRVLVLNKLSLIQIAMPHWPILSWKTIEELLAEQVAAVAQITSWRGVNYSRLCVR